MKLVARSHSFPVSTFGPENALPGMPVANQMAWSADQTSRNANRGGAYRLMPSDFDAMHLLTRHAQARMGSRRISEAAVQAVLDFGRSYRVGGARLFRMGWREVAAARRAGLDLSAHEGVHVVLGDNERVVTTWRCRTLRRLWR